MFCLSRKCCLHLKQHPNINECDVVFWTALRYLCRRNILQTSVVPRTQLSLGPRATANAGARYLLIGLLEPLV